METEWTPRKWTSDETNLFCEILAYPVNSFMETSEKRVFKNKSNKVFDFIITELKKGLVSRRILFYCICLLFFFCFFLSSGAFRRE